MALRKSIPTRPLWTGEQQLAIHNVAGLVNGQADHQDAFKRPRSAPQPRRSLPGALDMPGIAAGIGMNAFGPQFSTRLETAAATLAAGD